MSTVVLSLAWDWYKKRRRRLALSARFGPEIAAMIMGKRFWQGATEEMILESLGRPRDVDEHVMKTKRKHVFKYHQRGRGKR